LLALKAARHGLAIDPTTHQFERHLPPHSAILSKVHFTHPAFADE
jgi:hypothetical protein